MPQKRVDLDLVQQRWDRVSLAKTEWLAEQRQKNVETRDKSIPELKDFYAGRSVLVTGGTGFLGKVTIEKFLRSVPDLKTIYAIIRTKRNQDPAERMAKLLDSALFDVVRRDRPEVLKKVVAIAGDMSAKGLGLSEESRALLQREVSVVIHGAASVRFDDPLKEAILLNTRGTHEMIELSKGMKNLKAFVHISTTFCNTNQPKTMEKVYPTPYDWRHVIKIAEQNSVSDLNALMKLIIGFQPNTYTFTKQLSEKVVDDARHELPVFILRPSVVIGTFQEPFPGWTDNLNGPLSFALGANKGIISVAYGSPDVGLSQVPVDGVAVATIVGGWLTATNQRMSDDESATDVMNMSGQDFNDCDYGEMMAAALEISKDTNIRNLGYPNLVMTTCFYHFYMKMIGQVLFAAFIDLCMRLGGQKPRLLKLNRTIYRSCVELSPFTLRNYPFLTTNMWKLMAKTSDPDFYFNLQNKFTENVKLQTEYSDAHILKEKPAGPYHHTVIKIMHYVSETLQFFLFVWLAWKSAVFLLDRVSGTFQLEATMKI